MVAGKCSESVTRPKRKNMRAFIIQETGAWGSTFSIEKTSEHFKLGTYLDKSVFLCKKCTTLL